MVRSKLIVHSTWDLEVLTQRGHNSFRMVNYHVVPPVATKWRLTQFDAIQSLAECMNGTEQFMHPLDR